MWLNSRQPCATTRGVDHWERLLDVVEEEPIEEDFVRVLQRTQVDVTFEVVAFALIRLVRACGLLVERFDRWWQEAIETEVRPFLVRKCRTGVDSRIGQELVAGQ